MTVSPEDAVRYGYPALYVVCAVALLLVLLWRERR